MGTYMIVRHYQDDVMGSEVVVRGLTLEQAKAHCQDPETASRTATTEHAAERTRAKGPWFDGFYKED